MSYSFTVKAATKEDVKRAVADEIDNMIAVQPAHAKDRAAIIANASACIEMLATDLSRDIQCSLHGSVSWQHDAPDKVYGVGVNCSVHYVDKVWV